MHDQTNAPTLPAVPSIPSAPTAPVAAIALPDKRAKRKQVGAILVAFGVVSPLIGLFAWSIWRHPQGYRFTPQQQPIPGAPGPYDPYLAEAYRKYIALEGPIKRGRRFQELATWLERSTAPNISNRSTPMTEPELRFYLGDPDLVSGLDSSPNRVFLYFYDQTASRDAGLMVTLSGASGSRIVGQFGSTGGASTGFAGFVPFVSTSQPSSRPISSGP